MAAFVATVTMDEIFSDSGSYALNAHDFIALMQKAIADAPEGTKDTVKIEVKATTSWDEGVATVSITRSETEAEADAREAEQAKRWEARRASDEANLYRQYQALKHRFGE